jgi:hypothetical protein
MTDVYSCQLAERNILVLTVLICNPGTKMCSVTEVREKKFLPVAGSTPKKVCANGHRVCTICIDFTLMSLFYITHKIVYLDG